MDGLVLLLADVVVTVDVAAFVALEEEDGDDISCGRSV